MNKSDIDDALDFLDKLGTNKFTVATMKLHPFTQKLSKEKYFNIAYFRVSIKWHILANAVARGLVTYYSDTSRPYNAEKQRTARGASKTILKILRSSSVYRCEFEQLMVQDLLNYLLLAQAPIRGYMTEGKDINNRRRKLIQELAMSISELNVGSEIIWKLAKLVDSNIKQYAVQSLVRRNNFKRWEEYSCEFTNKVFVPYSEFRINHP